MARTTMMLVACMATVVSGSFLDRLLHKSHSEETGPELKVCNKGHNLFRVAETAGLVVTPYPPKRGEEFTVDLRGDVQKALQAVHMKVDVHYGFGMKIASTTVELCENTHCPIPAGAFHMTKKVTLPGLAPPGDYTITVHGTNLAGESVVCADMKVHVN